jgi:hypothetical protein
MTAIGKVMPIVFWDSQGVLLAHFQTRGENVYSASYCEVLLKLRDVIRKKIVQVNWQEGYCFILTMPDAIQPEQLDREFKNYSRNFLNIPFIAWVWPLVTSICSVH